MSVTVIPIVIGALGMLPMGLKTGVEELKSDNGSRSSKLQHC